MEQKQTRKIQDKISQNSKNLNFCEELKTSKTVHKIMKQSLKKKRRSLDRKLSKMMKTSQQHEVREK